MKKILDFIFHKANRRNIVLGVLFIFFINGLVFPFFPSLFNIHLPIGSILDLQFGFDSQYVYRLINFLGNRGRQVYLLSTLFIDIPYLFIYGLTYSLIFAYLIKIKKLPHAYKKLVLFPLLISLFDFFENIGIIYLMQFPYNYEENWIPIISLMNQLKWIFSILSLGVFLFLIIYKKK